MLIARYSLLITHYSLLTTHYSLLSTQYSVLSTQYTLLPLEQPLVRNLLVSFRNDEFGGGDRSASNGGDLHVNAAVVLGAGRVVRVGDRDAAQRESLHLFHFGLDHGVELRVAGSGRPFFQPDGQRGI